MFHCTCCECGNGLIGYMAEILARTEQCFCPIKHAHKVLGTHARYNHFLAHGEADNYGARPEAYRVALGSLCRAFGRKKARFSRPVMTFS